MLLREMLSFQSSQVGCLYVSFFLRNLTVPGHGLDHSL